MKENENNIDLDKYVDTKSKLNITDWIRIGLALFVVGLVLFFYYRG